MHTRMFIHSADAKRASVATKGRFISPRGVLLAALSYISSRFIPIEQKNFMKVINYDEKKRIFAV